MAVRGEWLLVFCLTVFTFYDLGRPYLPSAGGAPFFAPSATYVELQDNLHRLDGLHQINDADGILSVIKMANLGIAPQIEAESGRLLQPVNGKLLRFKIVGDRILAIEGLWMPASKRIALGVPLRVNQMNFADWCDLPGVGPEMARRIIDARQKSGEKFEFSDLQNVSGIGEKRLLAWRPYFSSL